MFKQVQYGNNLKLEFSFVVSGETVVVSDARVDVYDPFGTLVKTGTLQFTSGVYLTYFAANLVTLGSYVAIGRGTYNNEDIFATSRVQFDVVSTPSKELVTVDEVKEYLQISDYEEDSLLRGFVLAASKAILEYTQFTIGSETITEKLKVNNVRQFELQRFPVTSLTSVQLDDEDLLEDEDYYFDPQIGILKFFYPKTGLLTCTYTYGYSQIPADMRLACLKLVTTMYNLRESEGFSSRRLLSNVENYLRDTKMDSLFEVRSLLAPYKRKLV